MRRRLNLIALVLAGSAVSACGGGGIADLIDGGSTNSGNPNGAGNGSMSASEQADADEVLVLVNAERARLQLPPLVRDTAAERAAYDHAVDMDVRNYFDHDAPAPDASDPGQRLARAGASNNGWGENIADGYGSPSSVMSGWMNSSGHRANILYPGFTHVGVGVRYGTGGALWVQDFLIR